MIKIVLNDSSGSGVSETVKKNRPDLNAALLDQFVSIIPGAMFEKAMTQLISEGESTTSFTRKDNTTQNLVSLGLLILQFFPSNIYFSIYLVNCMQSEHCQLVQHGCSRHYRQLLPVATQRGKFYRQVEWRSGRLGARATFIYKRSTTAKTKYYPPQRRRPSCQKSLKFALVGASYKRAFAPADPTGNGLPIGCYICGDISQYLCCCEPCPHQIGRKRQSEHAPIEAVGQS